MPERRRGAGAWRLACHLGVYLALFAGAALFLLGASFAAHLVGLDLDGSRAGRLIVLGVYAAGAIALLVRGGG